MFSNFWAFALVFLWLGAYAHICQQNPTHASGFLSYFFSSRGEKWLNTPSSVLLGHFALFSSVLWSQICTPVSLPTCMFLLGRDLYHLLLPCFVTMEGCCVNPHLSKDHLLISLQVQLLSPSSVVPLSLITYCHCTNNISIA